MRRRARRPCSGEGPQRAGRPLPPVWRVRRRLAAGVRADIERRKRVDARTGRPARQVVIGLPLSAYNILHNVVAICRG